MPTEIELRDTWMAEAKDQTIETLPAFIEKLTQYPHDYGTVCRAMAAVGVAAMRAFNKSPAGGITGFQAWCVMWDVIEGLETCDAGPKQLVSYSKMLYPQYADRFEKRISPDTWGWLQKEAAEKIEEDAGTASELVVAHWRSIVAGTVPFGYAVASVQPTPSPRKRRGWR